MPPIRVIALGLGVAALAQTACSSSIPWPPRPGSCIEASIGKRKGARWRYRLDGEKVSRETIDRTLSAASPRWKHGVVSSDALAVAGITVLIGGDVGYISSLGVALGTKRPQLLLLTLASISMIIGGIAMMVNEDEPFHRAVNEYNQRSHCQPRDKPPPPPTEHSDEPPAPSGLPTLPSGSWTP